MTDILTAMRKVDAVHEPLEANDILTTAAQEIDQLRAENARLTADLAFLEQRLRERTLESQGMEGDYRELEAEAEQLKVDAARWRGLLSSARIRLTGNAGFDLRRGADDGYRCFGMEFWSLHSEPTKPETLKFLCDYADFMGERAARVETGEDKS